MLKSIRDSLTGKFLAFTILFQFLAIPPGTTPSYAQSNPLTPLDLSESFSSRGINYTPTMIRGFSLYPDNPLEFDFLVFRGDDQPEGMELKREIKKLIHYFLASLTMPEEELWVNLSPYEKDRIISPNFGQTEMGRDLLAVDFMLKQLTASMMSPEDENGRRFWDRVYRQLREKYGTTEVPLETFNKIWIVPKTADVYVNGTNVLVVDSHLGVMLEEDYLAMEEHAPLSGQANVDSPASIEDVSELSSTAIREVLLPEIEREVNEGASFAKLRQIYNTLILAAWYKRNLKESLVNHVYSDKGKIFGMEIDDSDMAEKIYSRYLSAFKEGVFDLITEEYEPSSRQMIPRKYFTGGMTLEAVPLREVSGSAGMRDEVDHAQMSVHTRLFEIGPDADHAALNSMSERIDEALRVVPAVGAKGSDAAELTLTEDPRHRLAKFFMDKFPGWVVFVGGKSSLDISKGATKVDALEHIFRYFFQVFERLGQEGDAEEDGEQDTVAYVGDEFYPGGNDNRLLDAQLKDNQQAIFISVDADPYYRSAKAKQGNNTIWIGAGPQATEKLLRDIHQALERGESRFTIFGKGMDEGKSAVINLVAFQGNRGRLVFDVDNTLLKKSENLDSKEQQPMRDTLLGLMSWNIKLGIISGNSRVQQMSRIADPLIREARKSAAAGSEIRNLQNLFMYANGGATLTEFNDKGEERSASISPEFEFTEDEISQFLDFLTNMSGAEGGYFGLSKEYIAALRDWFIPTGEGVGTLNMSKAMVYELTLGEKEGLTPSLVTAEEVEEYGKTGQKVKQLTLEIRGTPPVQITLKPFFGRIPIPAYITEPTLLELDDIHWFKLIQQGRSDAVADLMVRRLRGMEKSDVFHFLEEISQTLLDRLGKEHFGGVIAVWDRILENIEYRVTAGALPKTIREDVKAALDATLLMRVADGKLFSTEALIRSPDLYLGLLTRLEEGSVKDPRRSGDIHIDFQNWVADKLGNRAAEITESLRPVPASSGEEALETPSFEETVNSITLQEDRASELVTIRNFLVRAAENSDDAKRLLSALGEAFAEAISRVEGDSDLRRLVSHTEEVSQHPNEKRPSDRQVVSFAGGSAAETLIATMMQNVEVLQQAELVMVVGNTDSGGYSYLLEQASRAAGILNNLPPPGDMMNALQALAPNDRRIALGNDARLPKTYKGTAVDGVREFVISSLLNRAGGAINRHDVPVMGRDFPLFARILLKSMANVDKINDYLKQRGSEVRIPMAGASIRNLFFLGFLVEYDVIDLTKSPSPERGITFEGEDKLQEALDAVERAIGLPEDKYRVMVNSLDPKTLYAESAGWHVHLTHKGKSHVLTVEDQLDDGRIRVRIAFSEDSMEKTLSVGEEFSWSDVSSGIQGLPEVVDGQHISIRNLEGQAYLFIGEDGWLLDRTDINDLRLKNDANPEDVKQLSSDGTGRLREFEGRADLPSQEPVFTVFGREQGAAIEVRVISPLLKTETVMTETLTDLPRIRTGFLSGHGFEGRVDSDQMELQRANQQLISFLGTLEAGDIIGLGPASMYTSKMQHLMNDEVAEAFRKAKQRGVTFVLQMNATLDNETVGKTVFDLLSELENALQNSSGSEVRLRDIFSYVVGAKHVGKEDMPDGLESALNPPVEPELRYDLSAPSIAGKVPRGPLMLTEADAEEIVRKYGIVALRTPLALVPVRSRVPGADVTYRPLYSVQGMAAIWKFILRMTDLDFRLMGKAELNEVRQELHDGLYDRDVPHIIPQQQQLLMKVEQRLEEEDRKTGLLSEEEQVVYNWLDENSRRNPRLEVSVNRISRGTNLDPDLVRSILSFRLGMSPVGYGAEEYTGFDGRIVQPVGIGLFGGMESALFRPSIKPIEVAVLTEDALIRLRDKGKPDVQARLAEIGPVLQRLKDNRRYREDVLGRSRGEIPGDELRIKTLEAEREALEEILETMAEAGGDAATLTRYGGIDLNPGLLDMNIRMDGSGRPLPLEQQPLEAFEIKGFLPVILDIRPVEVPVFLGSAS